MALEVQVRVVEAKNLPKMDFFGSVDPYAVIRMDGGAEEFRTVTRRNTYEPVWNQTFRLTVQNRATDIVQILLFDADEITKDESISTLQISVKTLTLGEITDTWYNLAPVKGVNKGGRLRLMLQLAPTGRNFFRPYEPPT
jgi:Ca2+-dependent lipid-binding protein